MQGRGWIYGRGTLDDKSNVTAGLMVIMLKRRGVELDCEIFFLASMKFSRGILFRLQKGLDCRKAQRLWRSIKYTRISPPQ